MKIKKFNEMSEFGEHDQTIMKYETLKSNICETVMRSDILRGDLGYSYAELATLFSSLLKYLPTRLSIFLGSLMNILKAKFSLPFT